MEAKQMHNNRKWSRNLIFKIYHICWVLWEGIQFYSIAVAHIDKWKRKVFLWGIYPLIFCPPIAVFSSLSSPVVFAKAVLYSYLEFIKFNDIPLFMISNFAESLQE